MYTVYVLYSSGSGKHYTGMSSDLEGRLVSHNEMGRGWTSRYRPWKLIYQKQFVDKAEALAYERWLKSGAGRDFVRTIPH